MADKTSSPVKSESQAITSAGADGCAEKRKHRAATHATRHGLLSHTLEDNLVRRGENARNLRRYKKKFRTFFRPRGTLAELYFDRFWSCYLKLYVISKLEGQILALDQASQRLPILPALQERALPTLVSMPDPTEVDTRGLHTELPEGLFKQLALLERYDAKNGREMHRMAVSLLVMREGGEDALVEWLGNSVAFAKISKERK